MAGVLDHNRWDLVSLPALTRALTDVVRDPAAAGADLRALAAHYRRRGETERALELLRRNRSALCTEGLSALASLYRRRGDWDSALAIWESLAGQGVTNAIDALAKYLEHRVGDDRAALGMARRLPPGLARERRCRRLKKRLRKQTEGLGWRRRNESAEE